MAIDCTPTACIALTTTSKPTPQSPPPPALSGSADASFGCRLSHHADQFHFPLCDGCAASASSHSWSFLHRQQLAVGGASIASHKRLLVAASRGGTRWPWRALTRAQRAPSAPVWQSGCARTPVQRAAAQGRHPQLRQGWQAHELCCGLRTAGCTVDALSTLARLMEQVWEIKAPNSTQRSLGLEKRGSSAATTSPHIRVHREGLMRLQGAAVRRIFSEMKDSATWQRWQALALTIRACASGEAQAGRGGGATGRRVPRVF